MNTLVVYVILFVLVAYTNAIDMNITVQGFSAANVVTKCYYCTNCSRPFDRFDLNVLEVQSNEIWCAKFGTSESSKGFYTRSLASSNICSANGCGWKNIAGADKYVCCCDRPLCNTGVLPSHSMVAVVSTALLTTVLALKNF